MALSRHREDFPQPAGYNPFLLRVHHPRSNTYIAASAHRFYGRMSFPELLPYFIG